MSFSKTIFSGTKKGLLYLILCFIKHSNIILVLILIQVVEGKKHSKPPVSLIGQMYWREFYYVVGYATPNFDKMVGNNICCQIPWGKNDAHLKAWAEV